MSKENIKLGDAVKVSYHYFVRTAKTINGPLKNTEEQVIGQIIHIGYDVLTNDVIYMVKTKCGKILTDVRSNEINCIPLEIGIVSQPFVYTYKSPVGSDGPKLEVSTRVQYEKPVISTDFVERNNKFMDTAIESLKKYCCDKGEEENQMKIPEIDRVIFNDPATIIFWKSWHYEDVEDIDKTIGTIGIPIVKHIKVQDKTIVKCAPGETYNKYHGFCAAVAKYVFGTNSEVNRIVKNGFDETKKQNKSDTVKVGNYITAKCGDKAPSQCPYYDDKCGRKYTCKSVYNCGSEKWANKEKCFEYQKNEGKKNKKNKKKGSGTK